MTDHQIADILARYPTLTADGFGTALSAYETPEVKAARWTQKRAELSEAVDGCTRAERFLRFITKNKHFNRRRSSYSLKHKAEREQGGYVSNGSFIVAAIHRGFAVRQIGNTPNAFFNMGERSVMTASLRGWELEHKRQEQTIEPKP